MGHYFYCVVSSGHSTVCASLVGFVFLHLYRWWWNSNRYVTVKITASDCVDDDVAKHERIITRHLKRNLSHDGFPFVRTMLDDFEVPGLDGPHLCLVYEPMREPLWLFQRRWENGKLPTALLKVYLRFLLRGLDYLHSECCIIHTGKSEATCDINRGPGSFYHRS